MKRDDVILPWVVVGGIFILDALLWSWIIFTPAATVSNYYFLDVGQGDGELLIFPGGVKLLIDGGPDDKVSDRLSEILPIHDRYIDLVLMTHPQQDHMAGFVRVLRDWQVSAFLGTGRAATIGAYEELENVLKEKKISYITLLEGDGLRYGDVVIKVLAPSPTDMKSKELNDTSMVLLINDGGVKSIFTGDAGGNIEERLVRKYDLDADILKVGHHGSRFSSTRRFLTEVSPKISVVEVGRNSYGHPTKQALSGLASVNSLIFRTDTDGTIRLTLDSGRISAAGKKN